MIPTMTKTSQLQLADKVILSPNSKFPYDTATVESISEDFVVCIRPYIHCADFSMGGPSVITYIGFEKVSLVVSEEREVLLLDRSKLR